MKKVLVAMSGGVDSSVAAALLLKQGYFVAGAYMKNFSEESWKGVIKADCPWQKDMEDAKAVCERLGIDFQSFNFEKEYAERVIEYFFAEYAVGRTPNPDVMCNKEIKFGLFLEKAKELGFDYISTGHYARIKKTNNAPQPSPNLRGGEGELYELLKGIDPKKDQSYFLYALNQEQLAQSLFPIGEYTKVQVRQIARELGLPNAEKKDSQGVCFVGHINLREFLKQRIPERVGEIVTPTGEVIGKHRGAAYFTIGQRHGLGIGGGTPYYVAQKDIVKNKVVVAEGRYHRLVYDTEVKIAGLHWIGETPELPFQCQAKIRHQQEDQKCVVSHCEEQSDEAIPNPQEIASPSTSLGVAMTEKGEFKVEFKEPQFAVAPGQSVVFYDGETALGGGVIV